MAQNTRMPDKEIGTAQSRGGPNPDQRQVEHHQHEVPDPHTGDYAQKRSVVCYDLGQIDTLDQHAPTQRITGFEGYKVSMGMKLSVLLHYWPIPASNTFYGLSESEGSFATRFSIAYDANELSAAPPPGRIPRKEPETSRTTA